MARCDIIPISSASACSGKCKGGGCGAKAKIWVLAACEGVAAVFEKQPDGHLLPLSHEGNAVSSFADGLNERLARASENAEFSQLVIVGSGNDLSWTQASLPRTVSNQVVAEIEYPLMASWFSTPSDMRKLMLALDHLFEP